MSSRGRRRGVSGAATMVMLSLALLRGQTPDLVIANGRVLDPESNLDAARWIGIKVDPATVINRSTYREPALPPRGIRHVIVNGVVVVSDGQPVRGVKPGRPVRAGIVEHP